MELGDGLGHLSYSTLVHVGDTWAEIGDSLRNLLPSIKNRACPVRDELVG